MIRADISIRNKYYLNKHRYYELKHFCQQYYIWKQELQIIDYYTHPLVGTELVRTNTSNSKVENNIEKRLYLKLNMDMIVQCAKETDPLIGSYIFKGVTEGISYDKMNASSEIPCSKDIYYELYRKFFWLLDKKRK